jgi:shikimate 5-dehydrogenase
MGGDATYLPLELDSQSISGLFANIRNFRFPGISIGVPFLSSTLKYMDWIDPKSKRVGGIDLAVGRNGQMHGYNVWLYSVIDLIKSRKDLNIKRALVIGTGIYGRAAALGCSILGIDTFLSGSNMNRTMEIIKGLRNAIKPASIKGLSRTSLDFDMVINSIPLKGKTDSDVDGLEIADIIRKLEPKYGVEMAMGDKWTPFLSSIESRGGEPIQRKEVDAFSLIREHDLLFGKQPDKEMVEDILMNY